MHFIIEQFDKNLKAGIEGKIGEKSGLGGLILPALFSLKIRKNLYTFYLNISVLSDLKYSDTDLFLPNFMQLCIQ